jgi:hypothetical protein
MSTHSAFDNDFRGIYTVSRSVARQHAHTVWVRIDPNFDRMLLNDMVQYKNRASFKYTFHLVLASRQIEWFLDKNLGLHKYVELNPSAKLGQ